MIHKLSFNNFFSFKDQVCIDFTVDGHAPDTDSYFTDDFGNRISKIMTVVGANASGKTSLLKSVDFLRWFVEDSFSDLEPNQPITQADNDVFQQFLLCSENSPSSFEMIFGMSDGVYTYSLELVPDKVLSEKLEVKQETNRSKLIFSRKYDEKTGEYSNNFLKLDLPSDFTKLVRANSSVLSAAKQISNEEAIKIVDYFSNIESSFDEVGVSNNTFKALYGVAEFYHKQPKILAKVEKILQRFDLGIQSLDIKELERDDGSSIYLPVAFHKVIGSEKDRLFLMHGESGGTRNLFMLLKDVFSALETGNTVIFDELDNNLHPLMVPEIVNLFRSKKHNPYNAQLFFTTHNAQILSELDKQQIAIVEKNDEGISDVWRLSDVKDVRSGENYYSKYLAGFYGGIPQF